MIGGNKVVENLNDRMSIKLRERFCKDTNIPIKVFIEPYFSDRLNLFNKMYKAKDKYEAFMEEVGKFNTPQDYFEFYNDVKDRAINCIKESEAYQKFNTGDMSKYGIPDTELQNIRKRDIFKSNNDGKTFISVDLAKANFTALRWVDKSIVNNCDTYEQFIGKFCGENFKHIVESKYIRQVVFGNCNPGRQVTVESHIIYIIIKEAILKYFDYSDIECFSSDEVIINVPSDMTLKQYVEIRDSIIGEALIEDIGVHVNIFSLHNIENTKYFYKKFILEDENIEFKCVDGEAMPFVLRALYNEDITENDKVLMHNNMLAKLIDVPSIKI